MGTGEQGHAFGGGADEPDSSRLSHILLIASAIVALTATVLLVMRVGASLAQHDHAVERERHGYEVVLATRSVEGSIASAEAALGRYAIGGDRAMGAIYYDDWMMAAAKIARLKRLVANDRAASGLADRLSTLFEERGQELGPPALSAARHDGWQALTLFNATGRSPRIGAIDATLQAMRQHELDVLQRRTDQSNETASDTSHLIGLLSFTGIVLIVAAGGLSMAVSITSARSRAVREEADEAADRAAWLREAVDERTAELTTLNTVLASEMADRADAEARLRQMQKMDAIGQLTGGIAHDFNNMLAVVLGGLELARRRLETAPVEAGEHLDRAMEGANRAAQLTRRLLGFARAEPLLPERVEPARLIAGMSELIDRTLGERVLVETRIDEAVWPIFVDPLQLENAIVNLAVNGRDAMQGTGTLVISAANVVLGQDEVGHLASGDYVRVAVSDSGAGMTAAVRERLFEPFFTTKPLGQGTGLGLSQIFGFARQSGGDIAVDSVLGEGTTMSLYLPRAAALAPPAPPRPVAEIVRLPVSAPNAERHPILVVEDDPRVRTSTAEALAELGYAPIECGDAEAALAVLAGRDDIVVMVTDVVMPGMTGPELSAEVRRRHPEVSVLFVTGYAGEDGGELCGEALLRKPFTVAALERAVAAAFAATALNGSRPGRGAAAAE